MRFFASIDLFIQDPRFELCHYGINLPTIGYILPVPIIYALINDTFGHIIIYDLECARSVGARMAEQGQPTRDLD